MEIIQSKCCNFSKCGFGGNTFPNLVNDAVSLQYTLFSFTLRKGDLDNIFIMFFDEIFFGSCVATFMIAFIVWRLMIKGLLCQKLPARINAPPLPAEILKSMIVGLKSEVRETANWYNLVLQWMFRLSHPKGVVLWERFVWTEFRELPHDMRRLLLGYFILDGRLLDYYFGSHFPVFKNMATHKLREEGGECLVVVSDLEYSGDLEVHMQLDTVFGRSVEMYVCMRSVQGKFHMALYGDCLYYGFHRDGFEIEFDARVVVDEWWESSWLNWVFARHVFPFLYRSKFVMPNLKGKWLKNEPEQPPYPWDENSHELFTWSPKVQMEDGDK